MNPTGRSRLLVSVASAEEAEAAVLGGAEIVDVKDPARGALGAADVDLVRAVLGRVAMARPVTVALGEIDGGAADGGRHDAASVRHRAAQIATLRDSGAVAAAKVGWRGGAAAAHLGDALAGVRAALDGIPLVAVHFADLPPALDRGAFVRATAAAGCLGVLVDTAVKEGATLLDHWTGADIGEWIAEARAAGLQVGIAGSLGVGVLRRVAGYGADLIGVRGAACDGGRRGTIRAGRVAACLAQVRAARVEDVVPAR